MEHHDPGLFGPDSVSWRVLREATVKSHVSHLFDKLAATNRVQLAIAAFRAGLVD